MAEKKFSELDGKGAALASTDLLMISENDGIGGYVSKSVYGSDILDYIQPQYTEAERDALVSPEVGTLIFNKTRDRYEYYNAFWGWHPIATTFRDWGVEIIEDFHNTTASNYWALSAVNAGTIGGSTLGGFGIISISTGTNTNGGYRIIGASMNVLEFGLGLWRFESRLRIPTNSDATNTFQFISGFWDTTGSINQSDGIYFLYDAQGVSTGSSASGNWQIVTSSNSVRTFTTTSVAIDNANLQKLRIDVNAAATSVEFYINDTLVGTHTTNIPSGISRLAGSGIYLQKSAGTTARTADVDYLFLKTKFTTPR